MDDIMELVNNKKIWRVPLCNIQAHNTAWGHFSLPDIFWKKSGKTQESQDNSS